MANIDQLVVIASGAIPKTDPFLIDRVAAIAALKGCGVVVVLNKCDLDSADDLYGIYTAAGFPTVRVSAETGEGIGELLPLISGKLSAFTGNSGVGKSSILNALDPEFHLQVGDVSQPWDEDGTPPGTWSSTTSPAVQTWWTPRASPPLRPTS